MTGRITTLRVGPWVSINAPDGSIPVNTKIEPVKAILAPASLRFSNGSASLVAEACLVADFFRRNPRVECFYSFYQNLNYGCLGVNYGCPREEQQQLVVLLLD